MSLEPMEDSMSEIFEMIKTADEASTVGMLKECALNRRKILRLQTAWSAYEDMLGNLKEGSVSCNYTTIQFGDDSCSCVCSQCIQTRAVLENIINTLGDLIKYN